MGELVRKNIIVCTDCGYEIIVPKDIQDNEVLTCPCCSLEFVVNVLAEDVFKALPLEMEGVDWGE